jgi:hypothetical protein
MQVFILTVPSETMATKDGKTAKYMLGALDFKLRMTERLVRQCISTSFDGRFASLHAAAGETLIRPFLLAPMSLLVGPVPFVADISDYNAHWPAKTVGDSSTLQALLDAGNDQQDTLVVLAHHAYSHTDWIGWSQQMKSMTLDSSFGVAYS